MHIKFWLKDIKERGQWEISTKTEENMRTDLSKDVCVTELVKDRPK
jgi:hypothetical protein